MLQRYLVENFEVALDMVRKIKTSGNTFFNRGDFPNAMGKYRKALRYIDMLRDSMGTTREREEERIRALQIPCCLNIAAVSLKMNNFEEALKQCENILEVDPDNAKALYRRAQSRGGTKDYELALRDLTKARKLMPKDKSLLSEYSRMKKLRQKTLNEEKVLYAKMF